MKKQFTVICARNNQGLFTNFFHTLQHLEDAHNKKRIPIVDWRGGLYASKDNGYNGVKGENIWEYFFEPTSEYSIKDIFSKPKFNRYGTLTNTDPNVEVVSKFRNRSIGDEPDNCWNSRVYPPNVGIYNPNDEGRLFINSLITRHVKINDVVKEKINKFYKNNMEGHRVVGCHVRGTDHIPAQGHKFIIRYIKYAKKYILEYPEAKIFLATDQISILKTFIKELNDKLLYIDCARSPNNYGVHYGCRPKKRKCANAKVGEEALLDCVLLSKCDFLYRGFSNLSAASSFFNPNIPLHYVCKYNAKDKKYLEIDQ